MRSRLNQSITLRGMPCLGMPCSIWKQLSQHLCVCILQVCRLKRNLQHVIFSLPEVLFSVTCCVQMSIPKPVNSGVIVIRFSLLSPTGVMCTGALYPSVFSTGISFLHFPNVFFLFQKIQVVPPYLSQHSALCHF